MSDPVFIPALPNNGIFLPELDMRLDAHRKCDFGFVSHAHSDHFARHKKILCSTRTADLIAARYGRGKAEITALEFGEKIEIAGHQIFLLPAGHTLGSAQIHITRLRDGASLLYTGDFKTRTGLSAEPPEFAHADTLIMETTFGIPRYVFPRAEDIIARMIQFANDAIDAGDIPILLGYSLGKAQEILAALKDTPHPILVHNAVHEMTQIYLNHQPDNFPPYQVHTDDSDITGKILVFPPNIARSKYIQSIENRRLAMLSGWGISSSAKFRYRVQEVFPLSDHADYPGLLECVRIVKPRRVLTVHGYCAEFAADLRQRGIDAWSFKGTDQLEFPFKMGVD